MDSPLSDLGELLATDERRTLEFFLLGLRDIAGPSVAQDELLYNASVLAHYALVSTHAAQELPAPADLGAVFDAFVLHHAAVEDRTLLETAGAQCLLLAGFFEDQMRRRHNIRWYTELGAGFFGRAARHEPSPRKARLMDSLARTFESWRACHARLGRELRAQPYLLGVRRPLLG